MPRLPEERTSPRLEADSPEQLSASAWRAVLAQTVSSASKHRAPSTAASASFYALLGFFPGIAAFGAAMGLLKGPEGLRRQIDSFDDLVPSGVLHLIGSEAAAFAQGPRERLGLSLLFFSVVALFSATSAVRSLMEGLNRAYRVEEARHWLRRRLLALAFAGGIAAAFGMDVALIIRSGDYLSREPDVVWPTIRLFARWASLFALTVGALALLYRYGPDRRRARWRWVTPGSIVTAIVALFVSAGMAVYLAHFANYEQTYGGLGSVLGLAVWIWSSMTIVLVGAELNWAMECATSAVTDITGRPSSTKLPG